MGDTRDGTLDLLHLDGGTGSHATIHGHGEIGSELIGTFEFVADTYYKLLRIEDERIQNLVAFW